MKVINRKSKELVIKRDITGQKFFISVSGKNVFFTAMTALLCGLNENTYVHFLNDEAEWSFYTNDDKDGFKLSVSSKKYYTNPSYRINNCGLVNMILKSTGFHKAKRFTIVKTDQYQDRSPIFKLSLDNVSTSSR